MKNWNRSLALLLTMCVFFSGLVLAEDETHVHSESAAAETVSLSDVPTPVSDAETDPEVTGEPEATATPTATDEPEATATPEATDEPGATATPEATDEPVATATPTASDEPETTATPVATDVPEATATPTATDEPGATATPVATDEPGATDEPEATATPTASDEPVATAAPVATGEPEATATPTANECTEHDFDGTYGYDANSHWGICANCSQPMLPEESGVDSIHRFTDGVCFCGYVLDCDHANATLTGNLSFDSSTASLNAVDETSHCYSSVLVEYHCADCNTTWSEEETDYTVAHSFQNCVCTACQYVSHASANLVSFEYLGTDAPVNTGEKHCYTGKANASYTCSACGESWTAQEDGSWEANHAYGEAKKYNDNCHVYECACGAQKFEPHSASCTAENTDICSECGASGEINITHRYCEPDENEDWVWRCYSAYTHTFYRCRDCKTPAPMELAQHYASCANPGVCVACGYESTALAQAENLKHSWAEKEDGYVCSSCGITLSEYATAVGLPDGFDEEGYSDLYELSYNFTNIGYERYDEASHWTIDTVTRELYCCGSGESYETELGEMRQLEAHSYNRSGICTGCGYENPHKDCTHTNTIVAKTYYRKKSIVSANDSGHTIIADRTDVIVCADCGEELDWETTAKNIQVTERHLIEDGDCECSVCGYVPACKHENLKYDVDMEEDCDWRNVQKDSSVHLVYGGQFLRASCQDCGARIESANCYVTRHGMEEAHSFKNGICTACGFEEPEPTATPAVVPTATPTAEPTATPTAEPTATPTAVPTATPSAEPTATPTAVPTATPTAEPTATPTAEPTATPTAEPTATPTVEPTMPAASDEPVETIAPTMPAVSDEPIATPTAKPTATPTVKPTATATPAPTATPTIEPTVEPTAEPTPEPEFVELTSEDESRGVNAESETTLVETIVQIGESMEEEKAQGASFEIVNIEKVVTPEEKAVLETLPVKEQLLTFLSVIGFDEQISQTLTEGESGLSEEAVSLKTQILERIETMDEAQRTAFEEMLLASFPVEEIEIDGTVYAYFVVDIEVCTPEGVRIERYGFRLENGEWILTKLMTAEVDA